MDEQKIYQKGDVVTETGKYVCVPCGYHHHYQAGEKFGECTSCLANNKNMEDVDGTGMWEKKE